MSVRTLDKIVLMLILFAMSCFPNSGITWRTLGVAGIIFFVHEIVNQIVSVFEWMNTDSSSKSNELPVIRNKSNTDIIFPTDAINTTEIPMVKKYEKDLERAMKEHEEEKAKEVGNGPTKTTPAITVSSSSA